MTAVVAMSVVTVLGLRHRGSHSHSGGYQQNQHEVFHLETPSSVRRGRRRFISDTPDIIGTRTINDAGFMPRASNRCLKFIPGQRLSVDTTSWPRSAVGPKRNH
jgi:hypothetical protein